MGEQITWKACAKINLALDVTGRRQDGYHLVRMIMQSVDLCDELIMETIPEDAILLTTDKEGLECDEHNLVYRAVALIRETYQVPEGMRIHLKKRIPMAAGLAGGSTDCAAALRGANALYGLQLSDRELMELGAKLGADVPYCVMGGTALSEGIGEILTPLRPLPDCGVLLVKPPVGVSTPYVYRQLDSLSSYHHPDVDGMMDAIKEGDLQGVCDKMENVLELVTLEEHPVIREICSVMKECGAINAMMSGSGPTAFGIYESTDAAAAAASHLAEAFPDCEVFACGACARLM